ncbi:MAG: heme o synthase [Planctomycetota bacterium]
MSVADSPMDPEVTTEVAPDAPSKLSSFLELGKLRLSSMAIFSVVAGLYLGTPFREHPDAVVLVFVSLGALLVAAGGNALNMLMERERDQRMERTRSRPLPTGRLSPREVAGFGFITALVGLALIAMSSNIVATSVCAAIFITYVFVYTPMKSRTPMNTMVGAIPGALPPVVGYAAATGRLDLGALSLFLILFFWQIPHFLAIAWRLREDYAAAGMKMLSVTDPSGDSLRRQMLLFTAALVMASLLPTKIGLADTAYAVIAFWLGMGFLVPVFVAVVLRRESAMKWSFLASIIYLPLLFVTMVLDRPAMPG